MSLKMINLLFLLLLTCALGQESVKVVHDKGSCSVINFNCGGGQTTADEQVTVQNQGPPGKRGPFGATGSRGERGSKGVQGIQGETGNDADLDRVKKEIALSIGVRNCQEMKDILGVDKTGYYLIRDPTTMNAIFVLCDFQVRKDISTCKELETIHHLKESGFYWIKPVNFTESYQVFCNFDENEVTTEIWHDIMRPTKLRNCEAKGCYSATPEYNIKPENILKIIEGSRECRQYIKLRCHHVVIYSTTPNDPYAWWISRDGDKMLYWGGSTSRRAGYCTCGEAGNCLNKKYKCNCDNNGNVMTSDDGYLTDMAKLPVKKLFFGDAEDLFEYGWHTLGPLQCKG